MRLDEQEVSVWFVVDIRRSFDVRKLVLFT